MNTKQRILVVGFLFLIFCTSVGITSAKTISVDKDGEADNVSGYIYSTDENPIHGAIVYLSYTNGSYISLKRTSADGSYNFTKLPTGDYYIFAKQTNVSSNKSDYFTVEANITTWVNLTLYQEVSANMGQNISIDLSGSFDYEGDPLTFSCNRTDLFVDFDTITGKGNWVNIAEGTYAVKFGVSDGIGYTNRTIIITVSALPVPILPISLKESIYNYHPNFSIQIEEFFDEDYLKIKAFTVYRLALPNVTIAAYEYGADKLLSGPQVTEETGCAIIEVPKGYKRYAIIADYEGERKTLIVDKRT